MIYTTLLLSLAANGLWFNPVYENFIAPRKKRVELDTPDEEGDTFHYKETNLFARKPFNCLLCFGFWFAFLFFAIHSLFYAEAITVAFFIERLAACFAVSFLTVNIHKIVKLIPTKI